MDALILKAKAGDPEALEQLLASVAPAIERFGTRMCKNPHDAEDALQDTLIAVLRHLHEFEGRSSFTSWLFALVRTACNRRRRGLKNVPAVPLDSTAEPPEDALSPEDRALGSELASQVSRALEGLSDEHREAILLRDMEGLSAAEASEALGISVDALKSRLHRARTSLRAALQPVLEREVQAPASTCPDLMTLWSRKLDGDLSALDCAQMEAHLSSCPACSSTCDALKTALLVCKQEATRAVRPEVQASVKAAVRRWLASAPPPPLR